MIYDIEKDVADCLKAENELAKQNTVEAVKRTIAKVEEIEEKGGIYVHNMISMQLNALATIHGNEAANIVVRYCELEDKYGILERL